MLATERGSERRGFGWRGEMFASFPVMEPVSAEHLNRIYCRHPLLNLSDSALPILF